MNSILHFHTFSESASLSDLHQKVKLIRYPLGSPADSQRKQKNYKLETNDSERCKFENVNEVKEFF